VLWLDDMGDYKVAFKYHGAKTTDPKAYPWQVPDDKYALDRKILKEDGSYAMVERRVASMHQQVDPKTHLYMQYGKGPPSKALKSMTLYNTNLGQGSIPMEDRSPGNLDPVPQQGESWSNSQYVRNEKALENNIPMSEATRSRRALREYHKELRGLQRWLSPERQARAVGGVEERKANTSTEDMEIVQPAVYDRIPRKEILRKIVRKWKQMQFSANVIGRRFQNYRSRQNFKRYYTAKLKVDEMRKKQSERAARYQKYNTAAVPIQSAVRGLLARKDLHKQWVAAANIQKLTRGHFTRKYADELRRHQAQARYAKLMNARTKIQSVARGHLIRSRLRKFDVLQQQAAKYEVGSVAATRIKKSYRNYLHRKRQLAAADALKSPSALSVHDSLSIGNYVEVPGSWQKTPKDARSVQAQSQSTGSIGPWTRGTFGSPAGIHETRRTLFKTGTPSSTGKQVWVRIPKKEPPPKKPSPKKAPKPKPNIDYAAVAEEELMWNMRTRQGKQQLLKALPAPRGRGRGRGRV